MRSPEARPQDPPASGEGRLAAQLDAASNLALFGASKLGRDVCASIFLNHLHLLAADRAARQRLVECLLLLNMTNLLARLLRALHGVDLEATRLATDGAERLILSFSNGKSVNIPARELAASGPKRAHAAANWSAKLLDAAEAPATNALPPPEPAPAATQPSAPRRELV